MICSKIHRIVPSHFQSKKTEQLQEIVIGICDYIPPQLKGTSNLNIWIQGDTQKVINAVLWNQFFTKTLLKECYYQILQSYALSENCNNSAGHGIFIRFNDKIYKLQEVMDWKSDMRLSALKQFKDFGQLHIQSFNSQAHVKKISIFFGIYPANVSNINFELKLVGAARSNKKCENEAEKLIESNAQTFIKHKTKNSQFSSISEKSAVSTNKENNKYSKKQSNQSSNLHKPYLSKNDSQSKLSHKSGSKKSMKKKSCWQSDKKPNSGELINRPTLKQIQESILTQQIFPQRYRNSVLTNYDQGNRSANRQNVMSKIIATKDEAIIRMKEQLQNKEQTYQQTLRQMQIQHQTEVLTIKTSVKEILDNYQTSQKQIINQNLYLKDRVNILEESINQKDQQIDKYAKQFEILTLQQRQLQQSMKILKNKNLELRDKQEKQSKQYAADRIKSLSEINKLIQKCSEYKQKYQSILSVMKNLVQINDPK